MIKFTVEGNPITKKNHQQIIYSKKTGRPFLIQAPAYKKYEKEFVKQATAMYGNLEPIDFKVNLKCTYYMQTKRRVDLSNLINATCDCLVVAGLLEDDNSNIVHSFDGSEVKYDKENPRVEIEIESLVTTDIF